ncbi:tax1-binding protein 3 isoform X2 [Ursus maritimus]|uniref:Tax1-binding protein 3 n=1 Tax=Ursus maritimus TaxID=29073 RepID=A0A8M1GN24_URSMA|nr:tax1-binding protein 3 isoform X2 [Ursus maritimus]
MSYIPGQPVTAVVQRVEIHKLRQGENLILGFSIGGGIDQDPSQNPFSEDKTDKGIYVTRVSEGGPAEIAGLQIGDKIMQPRDISLGACLGDPGPQSPSCFQIPEGRELREELNWATDQMPRAASPATGSWSFHTGHFLERARREKSRGGKSEPMLPTASLECLPSY